MRRAPTDRGLGLPTLVERVSAEFPDLRIVSRTASGRSVVTYGEFAARVRRLASSLRRLGIGPGDRVATYAWNTQRHLELFFAVPCLGAVLEALNVRLHADEVALLLERVRPRLVFVDEALRHDPPTPPGGAECILIPDAAIEGSAYEQLVAGGDERFVFDELDELLPATACATSATTGPPKRVEYSHRGLMLGALVLNQPGVTPLRETDRLLPIVPLYHANAWGLPFAAMLSGAELVLPGPRPSSSELAELIARERVTKAAAVPTVFHALLEESALDLSSLDEVYCAGAPPDLDLLRAFRARGVELVHGWGMTETGFFGLISRSEHEELALTQGRSVPLVEHRIAPDGELQVRGPAIAGTYADEAAEAAYADGGWLRTGDLATLVPPRFVKLVDRLHDTIKSGGEWIHSLALESLLRDFDGVEAAAVVPAADRRFGERPYAFVTTNGDAIEPELLYAHLVASVPRWWIPDVVEVVDELPLTGTGKIDKRALRSSVASGRGGTVLRLRGAAPAPAAQ